MTEKDEILDTMVEADKATAREMGAKSIDHRIPDLTGLLTH